MSNQVQNRQAMPGVAAEAAEYDKLFPGDGGPAVEDDQDDSIPLGNNGGEQAGEQGGEEPPAAEAQPSISLSKADVAELIKSTAEAIKPAVQPAAPAPTPRQLTQEELETQFKVWKPTDDFVRNAIGSEDPAVVARAKTAFEQLRDGLTTQIATLMAQFVPVRINEATKELQEKAKALEEWKAAQEQLQQQQEAERFQTDFYAKYPKLQKYSLFVDKVSETLGDMPNKSREEVMAAYANGAAQLINTVLKDVGGQAPVVQIDQPSSQQNRGRMSTLSRGGQSGNRGKPQGAQMSSPYAAAMEVFK